MLLVLSGYIRRSPPSKPTKRNLPRPRRWGGRAGERGEGGTLESAGPPAATGRRSRAHRPAAEAPAALRRRSPSSLRPGTELRRRYHPGAHARPASPQSRTPARLGHPRLPLQAARAASHRRPRSHTGHGLPTRWGTRKVLGPGRATQTRPPAPGPLPAEKGKERRQRPRDPPGGGRRPAGKTKVPAGKTMNVLQQTENLPFSSRKTA
ncbi:translation initiation factor IF-2-like [Lontra canadensis]|uniref:translation initiation factor IF-2-like n=1 Tax=Lontra canadensis TaxID=76717 RepID=UPI0013F35550|nr:translation initiation factor IF-2-like [Lontra canadensis]